MKKNDPPKKGSFGSSANSRSTRPDPKNLGPALTRTPLPYGSHTELSGGVDLSDYERQMIAALQEQGRAPSQVHGRNSTFRYPGDSRIALGDTRSQKDFDNVISRMMVEQNMRSLQDRGQVNRYFLGGLVKSIGRVARTALPIAASFIPGVGGIAAGVVGGLMNQKANADAMKRQEQAFRDAMAQGTGEATAAAGPDVEGTVSEALKAHIDEMHQRRTTATGSLGGEMRRGGILQMGRGAVSFEGPSHEQGGIRISPNAEVEGGETMQTFSMKRGAVINNLNGKSVVFSNLGKPSFADKHRFLVKTKAPESAIMDLAMEQEVAMGRAKPQQFATGGALGMFAPGGDYGLPTGPMTPAGGGGGFFRNAGSWLGNNAGNIAMALPAIYNIGQGLFGKTRAPVQQQIQWQNVEGPDRADFGPVSREGLNALRQGPDLRLNYDEAYNRNSSALRTATQGMGTAGRLAALAQARQGNLQLAADQAQRQDIFNATRKDQFNRDYASMAQSLAMADSQARQNFSQANQATRLANAQGSFNAAQFNSQADYNNQTGRMQAQAAKQQALAAGLTGLGNLAFQRYNLNQQRAGSNAALMAAYAGASQATQNRMLPWLRQQGIEIPT